MKIRETFTTPYDQYAAREGQKFTMLKKITEPTDTIDEMALPMYRIRFEDGFETEAWPEEVETEE